MSSKYFQAQDFDYFFKSEPRELSVYDSLAWSDNFNHTVEGQGGIVLRALTEEVRRLNRIIHAKQISDTADIVKKPAASGHSDTAYLQSACGSIKTTRGNYQGTS